ncbi:MAG: hypothetical protein HC892_04510 [Saprospiraceae bacterium]|nr:hypothetical protein [Saprospiraceae bacterium]
MAAIDSTISELLIPIWTLPDSIVPNLMNPEPNKQEKSSISLGAQAAIESVSAGDWNNFSKQGWKLGVGIEYLFRETYSVSIGANYSYKPYTANGNQYRPAYIYPTTPSRSQPESAVGVCDILEIPVELGYYWKGHHQSGFFVKMGLSSYWMLREQYQFTYENPDPNQVTDIAVYNENKHWLAIGQIAVGYQRLIRERWRVQLMPYFQVPWRGVGEGNIELYSAGTTLKYYLSGN